MPLSQYGQSFLQAVTPYYFDYAGLQHHERNLNWSCCSQSITALTSTIACTAIRQFLTEGATARGPVVGWASRSAWTVMPSEDGPRTGHPDNSKHEQIRSKRKWSIPGYWQVCSLICLNTARMCLIRTDLQTPARNHERGYAEKVDNFLLLYPHFIKKSNSQLLKHSVSQFVIWPTSRLVNLSISQFVS